MFFIYFLPTTPQVQNIVHEATFEPHISHQGNTSKKETTSPFPQRVTRLRAINSLNSNILRTFYVIQIFSIKIVQRGILRRGDERTRGRADERTSGRVDAVRHTQRNVILWGPWVLMGYMGDVYNVIPPRNDADNMMHSH